MDKHKSTRELRAKTARREEVSPFRHLAQMYLGEDRKDHEMIEWFLVGCALLDRKGHPEGGEALQRFAKEFDALQACPQ